MELGGSCTGNFDCLQLSTAASVGLELSACEGHATGSDTSRDDVWSDKLLTESASVSQSARMVAGDSLMAAEGLGGSDEVLQVLGVAGNLGSASNCGDAVTTATAIGGTESCGCWPSHRIVISGQRAIACTQGFQSVGAASSKVRKLPALCTSKRWPAPCVQVRSRTSPIKSKEPLAGSPRNHSPGVRYHDIDARSGPSFCRNTHLVTQIEVVRRNRKKPQPICSTDRWRTSCNCCVSCEVRPRSQRLPRGLHKCF
mmetsp:Transcript_27791/g.64598  ORF Transcript_27791/g.64598 Transcript_27791/m.64598 type:complete len:256 (+) Transcript_27791:535-1302(+)